MGQWSGGNMAQTAQPRRLSYVWQRESQTDRQRQRVSPRGRPRAEDSASRAFLVGKDRRICLITRRGSPSDRGARSLLYSRITGNDKRQANGTARSIASRYEISRRQTARSSSVLKEVGRDRVILPPCSVASWLRVLVGLLCRLASSAAAGRAEG